MGCIRGGACAIVPSQLVATAAKLAANMLSVLIARKLVRGLIEVSSHAHAHLAVGLGRRQQAAGGKDGCGERPAGWPRQMKHTYICLGAGRARA
jgi:hypothetical protein